MKTISYKTIARYFNIDQKKVREFILRYCKDQIIIKTKEKLFVSNEFFNKLIGIDNNSRKYLIKHPCIQLNKQYNKLYPCIYFLFNKYNLVYIGQSRDVIARLKGNKREKIFDSFLFINVPHSYLTLVELININYHKPPLNKRISNKTEIFRQKIYLTL